MRNDLTIYDRVADHWWSDEVRWVRTLKNLVPGRLKWFDRHIDWRGKDVLDLGCAGGLMAEAMAARGANVTGIDPAADAVEAARRHADATGLGIAYDVGVGEALPYDASAFDAVLCVDVLEHVDDLQKVLAEVARVLRPGGMFLFDTINRNPFARFATITLAEDLLRLLPRGTHDPAMFIKPRELRDAMQGAGLVPGPTTGLGPRGLNRRLDLTFGPLPLTAILYMGLARKPAGASGDVTLGVASIAAVLLWPFDVLAAGLLALVAATTLPARQLLMPAINRATDAGAKARFRRLHGLSVVITLVHTNLRTLMIHGMRSAFHNRYKRTNRMTVFMDRLAGRGMHTDKIVVASANKAARIAWAVECAPRTGQIERLAIDWGRAF